MGKYDTPIKLKLADNLSPQTVKDYAAQNHLGEDVELTEYNRPKYVVVTVRDRIRNAVTVEYISSKK